MRPARRTGEKLDDHQERTWPWTAVLLVGVSALAAQAVASEPVEVPAQPAFPAQGKVTYVPRNSIEEFKALPVYKEPDWVTEKFVKTGKLPPVAERLPREPLVFKTGNMPDGIGVYGDTIRHVIGGRPEGWNYIGRPDPGLGRNRYRHVGVPDAHRAAVPGRSQ